MDPITLAITGISLGMQIFGGMGATKVAQQQAAVSGDIAKQEMAADAQRRQAMELDAQRKSMEVLRNAQRARSLALNSATNQGAQFGSGLQGGYGQISGQSGVNLLGINQNLQIGENLFDINAKIDQDKIQLASLGGEAAKYQGYASLGKAFGSTVPFASKIGQGFGPGYTGPSAHAGGEGYDIGWAP